MALDLAERYPGQTVDGDPNYPFGRARNVTAPGAGDGTPLEADLVNDVYGFLQALLSNAGITPSGAGTTPDTATSSQYLEAMLSLGRNGITISPTALAAATDVSNYAPTGWSTAGVVRLSAAGSGARILGLDSNAKIKTKLIVNADTSDEIELVNEDGSQGAGNSILIPGGGYYLGPRQSVVVYYDSVSAIWRIADSNQATPTKLRTVVRFVGAGYQSSSDAAANGDGWRHLNASPTVAVSVGSARAKRFISLDHGLPDGATITQVRVRVQPSAAHTLTDRMNAQLFGGSSAGTSISGSVVYDDGTTNAQWLTIGSLGVAVNKAVETYGVAVENNATFAACQIFGVEVTFTTNALYVG